jgi:hypothetical protein
MLSLLSLPSSLSSPSSSTFGEEDEGGGEEDESDLSSVPTVDLIWIRRLVRTNK